MSRRGTGAALVLAWLLAGPAAAQTGDAAPWPDDLTDPGAAAGAGPADLILPMPCGAAMAFQKVAVPVDAADPLADRRILLGRSSDRSGFSDYLRPAFLRGAFADAAGGTTHFYIARYELTRGQARALEGDCAAPDRNDRLAQGGLSWFDAVDLARRYSEWLLANAPETLPLADGAPGFLRLPTETEWEYAARGGAGIDATRFAAPTYFATGELRDHALFQAAGSARGQLGAVGLRAPNPLGLFDVYGNAEELMLEPFRLNIVGRGGGQTGGVVTRGGSVLSAAEQIDSAQRTEYPPFDPATGKALRADTFGVRFVLGAQIATSDARLREIEARWTALAEDGFGTGTAGGDPGARLAALIAAEVDPRRQRALSDLQLEVRRARDRAQTARQQSARATLLSGAVFVATLGQTAAEIAAKAASLRMLVDLQRAGRPSDVYSRQVRRHVAEIQQLRKAQSTYLLSLRTALETLAEDVSPDEREVAYAVLREELALSDRAALLADLGRFWADLEAFAAAPDLSPEALLRLALDGPAGPEDQSADRP